MRGAEVVVGEAADEGEGALRAGRLVLLGTDDLQPAASAGVDALWVAAAIRWAAGREVTATDDGGRVPEVVRLQLTAGERRAVTGACVVGVPLLLLAFGAVPRLRRRRAGAA